MSNKGVEEQVLRIMDSAGSLVSGDSDWEEALLRGGANYIAGTDIFELSYAIQLLRYPVRVEEFLFGADYLGKARDEIYPEVLRELIDINNPQGLRIVNPYTQGVFTGGIGSAKSTTALYTVAYQLYVLSCFRNPHLTFNLDRASEIVWIFQSINGGVANVDYTRFYTMLAASPYFRYVFPFNPRLKSEMHFPHRIEIKPIGADGGTIGQNVVGGLIDELNFMAVTQNSRKSIDGGAYNQALTIYNSVARRRKTRFQTGGRAPGILCLVSSKRYPGEFTDMILEDAKTDPSIYVYDKRVWDIKPPGSFSPLKFPVFVGDASRKAKVLEPEETKGIEPHLLVWVPDDFRKEFKDDLTGSLRDIAGVGTISRYPFFSNTDAVGQSFAGGTSILNTEESDFYTTAVSIITDNIKRLDCPRWVHVDLGVTSDAAGVSCGYVSGFEECEGGIGAMPIVTYDFTLRVPPPPNGEIDFSKIRRLITLCRQVGVPIKWVSFDSYQSRDSIQMLRKAGFSTGLISMDRSSDPYAFTKTAMYDGRVKHPPHAHARKEFAALEKDPKTGKIDHPAQGSKDCSDAIAGVLHGLTLRREVWSQYNIQFNAALAKIREADVKEETNG